MINNGDPVIPFTSRILPQPACSGEIMRITEGADPNHPINEFEKCGYTKIRLDQWKMDVGQKDIVALVTCTSAIKLFVDEKRFVVEEREVSRYDINWSIEQRYRSIRPYCNAWKKK